MIYGYFDNVLVVAVGVEPTSDKSRAFPC